ARGVCGPDRASLGAGEATLPGRTLSTTGRAPCGTDTAASTAAALTSGDRGEVAGRSPSDVPRDGRSAGAVRRSRLFVVRVDGPTRRAAEWPAPGARPPVLVVLGAGAPGRQRHQEVLGERGDVRLVHPPQLGQLVLGTVPRVQDDTRDRQARADTSERGRWQPIRRRADGRPAEHLGEIDDG